MPDEDKVVPIKKRARGKGRPIETKEFPRITIRLPPDVFEQLYADAAEHFDSLRATVLRVLRVYYRDMKKD